MTSTKADLMVLELSMVEDDSELFEESGAYDIVKTITTKIQKLIIQMSSWLKKIHVDIDVMIMEHEKSKRFKELENLIKNTPGGDKKQIKFCNVPGAVALYQKYMKKFESSLKSIMKKSFLSYSKKEIKNLNSQIDKFEEELEEFEYLVSEMLDEQIVKSGYDALHYIESCKKGINPVYKYYFNLIRNYEQFKIEAEKQLYYKVLDTNSDVRKNMSRCQVMMSKLSNKSSRVARKVLYKVIWWTV